MRAAADCRFRPVVAVPRGGEGTARKSFISRWDSVAKSGEGGELAELSRSLRGDAEQLADEFHLGYYISFARPSHPPFSDHVHGLNATQGPPRCRL